MLIQTSSTIARWRMALDLFTLQLFLNLATCYATLLQWYMCMYMYMSILSIKLIATAVYLCVLCHWWGLQHIRFSQYIVVFCLCWAGKIVITIKNLTLNFVAMLYVYRNWYTCMTVHVSIYKCANGRYMYTKKDNSTSQHCRFRKPDIVLIQPL